ncbi:hypothetical protein AQUCO_02200090v1 [Aquilegia coerulea]|uniref:Uncharacterized protein n=1 Tax=Aquilegia coerulea TaxID=218851 RepID=A0A2G5DD33_AQUCA|nr:hypothetical protein AQUCO_02200090v1 [Aquilegia coerulea]
MVRNSGYTKFKKSYEARKNTFGLLLFMKSSAKKGITLNRTPLQTSVTRIHPPPPPDPWIRFRVVTKAH